MNDDQYMDHQQLITGTIAPLLSAMDLDGFLAAIERAEAMGPILDPSLYMAGHRNLAVIKRIARALKHAQTEIDACAVEMAKREGRR